MSTKPPHSQAEEDAGICRGNLTNNPSNMKFGDMKKTSINSLNSTYTTHSESNSGKNNTNLENPFEERTILFDNIPLTFDSTIDNVWGELLHDVDNDEDNYDAENELIGRPESVWSNQSLRDDLLEKGGRMYFNNKEDVEDLARDFSMAIQPTRKTMEREKQSFMKISRYEDTTIRRLKIFVVSFLVVMAIVVAVGVFFYLQMSERKAMHRDYYEYADKVASSFRSTIDLTMGAIDTFVVGYVSHAKSSNSEWPFVTLPDYAVRSARFRSISKALQLLLSVFVSKNERLAWEDYAALHHGWINDSFVSQQHEKNLSLNFSVSSLRLSNVLLGMTGPMVEEYDQYLVSWQQSPLHEKSFPYNFDLKSTECMSKASLQVLVEQKEALLSATLPNPLNPNAIQEASWYLRPGYIQYAFEPVWLLHYPILDSATQLYSKQGLATINTSSTPTASTTDAITDATIDASTDTAPKVVGILTSLFFFRDLLKDILPNVSTGLVTVFKNSCNQTFTYQINGPTPQYLGIGDLHDNQYNELVTTVRMADMKTSGIYERLPINSDGCEYTISIYPSKDMEANYLTWNPVVYSTMAVLIFVFTSVIFLVYDGWVERRQRKVLRSAVQSSAIVSSLFPSNVRSRLFPEVPDSSEHSIISRNSRALVRPNYTTMSLPFQPIRNRLKSFLELDSNHNSNIGTAVSANFSAPNNNPIADFFPEATVLFADISGFTAWSSIREPTHVFILLESVYFEFDRIAERRGVFKVETIGDSYVAVTGLPEPRQDHALVMAKFACDCRSSMAKVTRMLEVRLGPDTGDLKLRLGLHSGPVTAGVLRGARTRFQLFGDTVNTASRIESNGIRDKIQVSAATANLLIDAGKSHWLVKREDLIEAKGKGKLQTYFIEAGQHHRVPRSSSLSSSDTFTHKTERLVDWCCDIFEKLLCEVIARRKVLDTKEEGQMGRNQHDSVDQSILSLHQYEEQDKTILDEVKDIIELPEFDNIGFHPLANENTLTDVQRGELRAYINTIANLYKYNPFHNFEHAVHVTMSVTKLLARILAPDAVLDGFVDSAVGEAIPQQVASSLHKYTYGITSDPLTQFACVFSSLIHDVDHAGVPNCQLVQENVGLAQLYRGKSVAEQNSIDVAWHYFMKSEFDNLRKVICETENEMRRFRQLVINCVMATDVLDLDLNQRRNEKWDIAFSNQQVENADDIMAANRKATIVIEHLIQASDVAHTMQHWQVYRVWNERLFEEMFVAFKNGRAQTNPSQFWYEGEISFFDNYIIPLARKLHDCGVFGVSSHEYMAYAIKNREEWEICGKEIVANLTEKYEAKFSNQMSSIRSTPK